MPLPVWAPAACVSKRKGSPAPPDANAAGLRGRPGSASLRVAACQCGYLPPSQKKRRPCPPLTRMPLVSGGGQEGHHCASPLPVWTPQLIKLRLGLTSALDAMPLSQGRKEGGAQGPRGGGGKRRARVPLLPLEQHAVSLLAGLTGTAPGQRSARQRPRWPLPPGAPPPTCRRPPPRPPGQPRSARPL